MRILQKHLCFIFLAFAILTGCSKTNDPNDPSGTGINNNNGNNTGSGCTLKTTATGNAPISSGETIELTGNATEDKDYSNFIYQWTGPNNFSSDKFNAEVPFAGTEASGTYTFTVTSGSCKSQSTVNVTVNPVYAPCNIKENTVEPSSGLPTMNFSSAYGGLYPGSNYWSISGSSNYGDISIIFKKSDAPAGNKVYILTNDNGFNAPDRPEYIKMYINLGSSGGIFKAYSGKVYIDKVNGKINAKFCDIIFEDSDGLKFTASGNLTCQ